MGKRKRQSKIRVWIEREERGLWIGPEAKKRIAGALGKISPSATAVLGRKEAIRWLNANGYMIDEHGTSNQAIMDALLTAPNLPLDLKIESERWTKKTWWKSVVRHLCSPATVERHQHNLGPVHRPGSVVKRAVEQKPRLGQPKEKNGFYWSDEWRALRYRVLKEYGRTCMCCGAEGNPPHVDHIKPRSRYPELALSFDNLQVLCVDCNMGKGAWDETDWRPKMKGPEI